MRKTNPIGSEILVRRRRLLTASATVAHAESLPGGNVCDRRWKRRRLNRIDDGRRAYDRFEQWRQQSPRAIRARSIVTWFLGTRERVNSCIQLDRNHSQRSAVRKELLHF